MELELQEITLTLRSTLSFKKKKTQYGTCFHGNRYMTDFTYFFSISIILSDIGTKCLYEHDLRTISEI